MEKGNADNVNHEYAFDQLRGFNLEMAQRGAPLGFKYPVHGVSSYPPDILAGTYTFVAGADARGVMVVLSQEGNYLMTATSNLFMKPLTWLKGAPVYCGDTLFFTDVEGCGEVVDVNQKGGLVMKWPSYGCVHQPLSMLSWTPVPIKKSGWINIYRDMDTTPKSVRIYHTQKEALDNACVDREDTIPINWTRGGIPNEGA